ncbi:MAG: NAD(+) diphosphatase [Frankiaceae bacterium]
MPFPADGTACGRPPALSRGTVDRAAMRREDEAWLAAAWDDPRARALVVRETQVLVKDDADGPSLVLLPPAEAPPGARYFLGESDGAPYFAVSADSTDSTGPAGARAASLREVGAALSDRDAGLVVHAVALDNWHATHPRCPRCGRPTTMAAGGHVRRCQADGSAHFPRTDPAVIMLVHDGGDRCALGRQPSWPEHRFSTLAGFVEPGESAEQAVVREVAEEVGLPVTDVEYRASQPWPFPSSLMLGFRARATAQDIVLADGEIAEARWFGRAELREASRAGEVLLPPPVSIAHRLIFDWLAAR